jgi:hypothetical protein
LLIRCCRHAAIADTFIIDIFIIFQADAADFDALSPPIR